MSIDCNLRIYGLTVILCPQYGQKTNSFSNWLEHFGHTGIFSTSDLFGKLVFKVNLSGISFKKLDSFPFSVIKNSLSLALVIAT